MWLYGSGFPKSMNIGLAIDKKNGVESKIIGSAKSGVSSRAYQSEETTTAGEYTVKEAQNKWKGWGTALKPSFEPIIVARKPFKGSLVDNVIQYGVGGINIDECRVGSSKEDIDKLNKEWDREWNTSYKSFADGVGGSAGFDYSNARTENKGLSGRFPANTILTYDETDFEEVCGGFPNTKGNGNIRHNKNDGKGYNCYSNYKDCETKGYEDSGSAARYFYCAKASKKDRDEGLEDFETKSHAEINNRKEGSAGATRQYGGGTNPFLSVSCPRKNTHPTVKPTELMQYLVRLVTPQGGVILDPFMGSGSTGKAVMYENKERNVNYKFIGIEKEKEYCDIAEARINYVINLKLKK